MSVVVSDWVRSEGLTVLVGMFLMKRRRISHSRLAAFISILLSSSAAQD